MNQHLARGHGYVTPTHYNMMTHIFSIDLYLSRLRGLRGQRAKIPNAFIDLFSLIIVMDYDIIS